MLLLLLTAGVAFADDLNLGANRAAGMAGAGLALRQYGGGTFGRNPAMFAYGQSIKLNNLDIGYHLRGSSFSEIKDSLGGTSSAGVNGDNLQRIAKTLGNRDVELGVPFGVAIAGGGFNVGVRGGVMLNTVPNAPLKAWVGAGAKGIPDAGSRLDGFGFGYYSIDLGYGHELHTKSAKSMSVGAQLRIVKGYYSHQFVDQNQIANGGSTKATEMGKDDVLSQTGTALDLGWHMETMDGKAEFGAVVNNFVRPNVNFDGTGPGGTGTTSVNPFERSLSVGSGFHLDKGVVVAADYVDIGTYHSEFRAGLDVPLGKVINLTAGVGSRGGVTVGVSAFGINLAFGQTNGFQAGTFFRF